MPTATAPSLLDRLLIALLRRPAVVEVIRRDIQAYVPAEVVRVAPGIASRAVASKRGRS